MGEGVKHRLQQLLRLRHLPLPHGPAGQASAGRLHNLPAVPPQEGQVILGNRILIHAGVHGGRGDFGTVTGQNGGGEHIVGQTVGKLSQNVGRGRGHQYQVGLVGQGDVLHLELVVAVKGVHAYPVARQGFKGVGADKLRGVSGHEYLDVRPLLHQGRGQARRLIACNAAGDTQQHSFPL